MWRRSQGARRPLSGRGPGRPCSSLDRSVLAGVDHGQVLCAKRFCAKRFEPSMVLVEHRAGRAACRSGTVPMERSDAAGPSLQIDASASAFAALHPPAGKRTRAPDDNSTDDVKRPGEGGDRRRARARRGCRSCEGALCSLGAVAAAAARRHPRGHRRGRRRSRSWRSCSSLRLCLAGSCLLLRSLLRSLGGSRFFLLRGNRLLDLLHLLRLRFRLLRLLCHARPPDRLANGPTLMPALE